MHHNATTTPQERQVVEFKKDAHLVKMDSYQHPRHPVRQQYPRKRGDHQTPYGPRWLPIGNQTGSKWKTQNMAWPYQRNTPTTWYHKN